MTKDQLTDKLHAALAPIVESFVSQPSPSAAAQEGERKSIEERRAVLRKSLGENDPAYRAASDVLDQAIDGLKLSTSRQKKENLRLVAEALVHTTNTLRIPVKLKTLAQSGLGGGTGGRPGNTGDGRRNRKNRETLAQESAAVLKALPRTNAAFVSKSEITSKVGFDPTSALLKLKREGEASSNGRRGAGGGWRKA